MSAAFQCAQAVLDGASPRDFLKALGPPFRRFKYTFDFGAGELGYAFLIDLEPEMVEGLKDEKLEHFLIEYGMENIERDRIPRDDWFFCTGVEEVPAQGHLKDWYHGESQGPREFLKSLGKRGHLKVGESISRGTLNAEHLIRRFLDTLEQLRPGEYADITDDTEVQQYLGGEMGIAETQDFEDNFLHEVLWSAMARLCPPLTYFGAHPGNASDFGAWPYEDHDYHDLAEAGTIIYARRDSPTYERVKQGDFSEQPEAQYAIIADVGFECYDKSGTLLWQY